MTSRRRRNKKAANKTTEKQLCMQVKEIDSIISSNGSNHFGYSPFELIITVTPKNNKRLEAQPFTVQLVFEDGKQIQNNNNISLKTVPKSLCINKNGTCKFSVQIDTYSIYCDNQAFKLVFKLSENATRHIRPCETKPFHLVKNRLEISNCVDDIFFKDEGGKSNFLHCQIFLKDCKKKTVVNRDIVLSTTLLYEDMSIVESSHDILELLTSNMQLKQGQCNVEFRITEVSKNHNKRSFRVLFKCKSNDPLYSDISSSVTNPILVKSKRTKRKSSKKKKTIKRKRRKQVSLSPIPYYDDDDDELLTESDFEYDEPLYKKQKIEGVNVNVNLNGDVMGNIMSFCALAGDVMNKLQWTQCGYELNEMTNTMDTTRPIYRCSYCLKYRNKNGWGHHEQWCQLQLALTQYETQFKPSHNNVNAHMPPYGMPPIPPITNPNHNLNNNVGLWPFGPLPHPIQNGNGMHGLLHYESISANQNQNNHNINQNNSTMNLPLNMRKISSVSRIRSQYGYDAFDQQNNFLGSFNENGDFLDANLFQNNNQYTPHAQLNPNEMILRNQSNDSSFYHNIRNNIVDSKWAIIE